MGEVGPAGCTQGGVSALAIGKPAAGAAALLEDLKSLRFEDAVELVTHLAARIGHTPQTLDPSRHCFVTLNDGLSGMEEILLAGIGTSAPDIPLVGGSAGDGFVFKETQVALNGAARAASAVVLLLEPGVPFHTFHSHHFHDVEQRFVATEVIFEQRIVNQLNGRPATEVAAELMGVTPEELKAEPARWLGERPLTFSFAVGEQRYLRSIMTVIDDALLMAGPVDLGMVLRLAVAGDLVAETRQGVHRAIEALGADPAGLVVFNCGGRMMEATQKDLLTPLAEAMCHTAPTAGFSTYGEQFGPLQINHTLTGLLFGHADG